MKLRHNTHSEEAISAKDIFNTLNEKEKEIFFRSAYFTDENIVENLLFTEVIGLNSCESPIERYFMLAHYLVSKYNGMLFEPQQEIHGDFGTYRADFLFDSTNTPLSLFYNFEKKYRLVIECDGHAFHSTKEQIAYDNQRTADLLKAGYAVLHFSGSQLYDDAIGCAITAENLVLDNLGNITSIEREGK